MFFVGLAGSIIPYILLMGVMLVFTFGANAEVMKKLSPEKREANVLKVEVDVSASFNDPVNFQISAYDFFDKFSKEQTEDLSADEISCLPEIVEINSPELFSEMQPHYRPGFPIRYFGLSPPFMV